MGEKQKEMRLSNTTTKEKKKMGDGDGGGGGINVQDNNKRKTSWTVLLMCVYYYSGLVFTLQLNYLAHQWQLRLITYSPWYDLHSQQG